MSDRKNVEAIYPLAPAQRGMLYYCALHPEDRATYFEQWEGTYGAPLDPAVLRRAWQWVVDRHPALRTLFLWERRERPLQVVRREIEVPWREEDWRSLSEPEQEERLAAFRAEDRETGFALDRAPLLRLALIRTGDERWRLLWSFHHLVVDGWSIALILREVHTAYAAMASGAEPELAPAHPYKEFIGWLGRRDEDSDRAFWVRELDGLDRPFETPLPAAAPDAVGAEDPDHGRIRITLPEELVAKAARATGGSGLTLNALAQGAFAVLLGRYAGTERVTYGTVSSGRPPELEGVEGTVGVFMNAMPSRPEVPADAEVGEWLRALQLHQVEARDHGHCALEDVQRWAGLPTGQPLSDALLIFENYPSTVAAGEAEGPRLLENALEEQSVFPFCLYVTPRRTADGDRVDLAASYDRRRFDDAGVRRALDHYARLLDGLAEGLAGSGERPVRLGDLRMVPEADRSVLHGEEPETSAPAPVHEQVAARAEEMPDAIALEGPDGALSYAALWSRAEALARRLRAEGAGRGAVVALALERSLQVPVAMLGVLRAGAAYLPVDPAYPEERIELMLDDAGVDLVVTDREGAERLPLGDRTAVPVEAPETCAAAAEGGSGRAGSAGPEDAVYLIYTSGSTGRPKGVVVEHRNLASYVETSAAEQAVAPGSRVLQFASISFDTSAEEIWPCLTRGGTLVLRDRDAGTSARGFCEYVAARRVEVVDLPTAFWHELAASCEAGEAVLPDDLRMVIIGGERALGERLAAWHRIPGAERIRLLNTYGPTEATIVSVSTPLEGAGGGAGSGAGGGDAAADPPIGRPIPGATVAVLDSAGHPVPLGVPGEVTIGGPGVTRGYLGRPALTAERFVPDPYSGVAGARLYRTGDLCSVERSPEGEGAAGLRIVFRGRIDAQVKVRGYRVEPGEIESTLTGHPEVGEAAVVPVTMGSGADRDVRLVAYVAPRSGRPVEEAPDGETLRAFLGERLPEFMIPALHVALEALPKTPSGKVDRRALPEPSALRPDGGPTYVAPRTPTEELLAGLWSELLGLDRIGARDDFFALGGHSLLVGRLAARLRSTLGVELPLIEIFENPTVAELARVVERAERGGASDRVGIAPELPPLVPVDRSGPLPLSYQQERVWFLQQLVPGSIAYNFQMRVFLWGDLDVSALERALSEIIRRHEVLRSIFPEQEGRPVQIVQEPWAVELPVIDLSERAEDREEAERLAEKVLAEEVAQPFTLDELPLIRWRLLRVAPDYHQLIQVEHHFVHDGWSVSVLLKELKALYEAFSSDQPSPLEELAVQYGDFATWQRGWMEGDVMDRLLSYWTEELEGAPTRLDLPADRPRPRKPTMQGDAIREFLPAEIYRGLRAFGRREGFTLFMTMSAAFQALMARYTGREDFLVGTGIANRRVAEVEPLIGMMVNSLVLRADVSEDPTFRELLVRVRRKMLGAHAHQDMPFERLVEELQPERDPSINPLFQVMFSFHDAAVPDLSFGGLEAGFLVEHNRSAKTDLNVIVAPRAEQRVGREASEMDDRAMVTWEFNTDLFDRATIERLIRHYLNVVAAAIENPDLRVSELPLMAEDEWSRVTSEWTARTAEYPQHLGMAQAFLSVAEGQPDAIALSTDGEQVTYGELARRARHLAGRLQGLGVRRGEPVGLAVERSVDLPAAMLGILCAGGAYLPLDPDYPEERLAWMLEDAAPSVVVTGGATGDAMGLPTATSVCRIGGWGEADPGGDPPPAGPDDLAYLIYTSGSTGRPKGVGVTQRGVVRLAVGTDMVRGGADETYLLASTISFDAATIETWCALLTGARLAIHPPEPATPETLGGVLARSRVTTLFLTPVLLNQAVDAEPGALAGVRHVVSGGEAASPAHYRRLLDAVPDLVISNLYGPTENAVVSTHQPVTTPREVTTPVPIGRPIASSSAYVLDSGLRPVPIGVPGELVVGGDGLARGYWDRPALTAERFVPHPFAGDGAVPEGARLYRTGDLVRWLPDGAIEFLGRNDQQVKVRGFRIEPAEVETVLAAHPEVAEALVDARELGGSTGGRSLIAWLVPTEGEEPDGAALREFLRDRLPAFMVPQAFVVLPALPVAPGGKVDRTALPDPEAAAETAEYVAPRNTMEEAIAAIWTEYLSVDRVGVRDDFFALGGHSLVATRIAARIRSDLGGDVPLTLLFEEPTVEGLARYLEGESGAATAEADAVVAEAEDMSEEDLDALLGRMMAEQEG